MIEILNKISYVLFFLSILNVVRTSFFVVGSFVKSDEENPQKLRLSRTSLILLGLSISYIITVISTGIKIIG
jgi:hypothetical protein